jgi:hypothetical protein
MKTNIIQIKKWSASKNKLRGVAMVEALMAISILMVSMMAPLTLSTISAKYARYGLYKITATSLAEEQIELMINYKKSWDIYCFNANADCINGSFDGFDDFVKTLKDSTGLNGCGISKPDNDPCYFDEANFYYDPSARPGIDSQLDCRLKNATSNISRCQPSEDPGIEWKETIYDRKMYVESADMQATDEGVHNNAVKLTSIVCINIAKADQLKCEAGGKDAVTLIHYIYR